MNERAKPIEAGCRAMILSSPSWPEWAGKIVTVVSQGSPTRTEENFWLVDVQSETCGCYCLEPQLLRLDDPEILEQIEEEDMARVPSPYISTGMV